MTDDRLLPIMPALRGGETLRVMGPDGKRALLPVAALLDMAERRFVSRSSEQSMTAALQAAVVDLAARLTALEAVYDALPVVDLDPLRAEVSALAVRVALLESVVKIKPKDK